VYSVDDKYIAQTFTADTLEQRKANKGLQVGLEVNSGHFNWHGNEAGGTKIDDVTYWIGS